MSDPLSDFDPVPVVPLEYEQSSTGVWGTVVNWVCIVSAIFLGASLLLETVQALLSFSMGSVSANFMMGPGGGAMLLYYVLPILLHGAMLIGCLLCLRLNSAGWHWVVWGSIAALVFGLILLVINSATYVSRYGPSSATSRSLGPTTSYYLYSSLLTGFINFVRSSFVPVMLLFLFFREEVRQMFRR